MLRLDQDSNADRCDNWTQPSIRRANQANWRAGRNCEVYCLYATAPRKTVPRGKNMNK